MLIHAFHAAFEEQVIALNRVGVDFTAPVLVSRAVDESVHEFLVQVAVVPGVICHNRCLLGEIGSYNRHDVVSVGTVNVEAAGLAVAADQCQHGVAARLAPAGLLLVAL